MSEHQPPHQTKKHVLQDCLIGLLAYEDRFDQVVPAHIQWICERLAWHKVLPLAAALSNESKPKHPSLKDVFKRTTLGNMIKEEHYIRQARSIFNAFDAAAIDYLPFKGPFWIGPLYAAYHWRHIGDIDILTAKKNVPRAASILLSMGYKVQALEGSMEKDMAIRGELAFFPQDSLSRKVPVELHWDVMPSPRFIKKKFLYNEDLTTGASTNRWQGITYRLPRPEIQLMYHLLHATCQHQFKRFCHLATIVHFIEKHPGLDWELLYELAAARKADTPLYFGLKFADTFRPLPEHAKRLKRRLKPSLAGRIVANCLPPRHTIDATGKRGAVRRKIFRAAISW